MSLEAAIAETNTLLRELIGLQRGQPAAEAPKALPTRGRASSDDKTPAAPAATPPPQTPAAGVQAPTPEPAAPAVPYTEVAQAIVAVGKAFPGMDGRTKVLDVLAKFEQKDKPGKPCENGKHLKEADYPAALKALSALVTA